MMMQRYSLLKAGAALVFICCFVVVQSLHQQDEQVVIVDDPTDDVQEQRDFRNPVETIDVNQKKTGRQFTLELESLKDGANGTIVIETKPSWAPLGVQRFHELMDDNFYDQAKFFRVVDDFIVQFGINADPKKKKPSSIQDEDDDNKIVKQTNSRGTVTFAMAGKNSRDCQLFINTNTAGNAFLDNQKVLLQLARSPCEYNNLSSITQVTMSVVQYVLTVDFFFFLLFNDDDALILFHPKISGMEVVDAIYDEYGEQPDQGQIQTRGNEYLDEEFPLLSYISKSYEKNNK